MRVKHLFKAIRAKTFNSELCKKSRSIVTELRIHRGSDVTDARGLDTFNIGEQAIVHTPQIANRFSCQYIIEFSPE